MPLEDAKEVKREKCGLCGNYHLKGEKCPNMQIEFRAARAEKCEKCGEYHMKGEDCPKE